MASQKRDKKSGMSKANALAFKKKLLAQPAVKSLAQAPHGIAVSHVGVRNRKFRMIARRGGGHLPVVIVDADGKDPILVFDLDPTDPVRHNDVDEADHHPGPGRFRI